MQTNYNKLTVVIEIWTIKADDLASKIDINKEINKLPKQLKNRGLKYIFPKDRLDFIAGRLLIKKALEKNMMYSSLLGEISYSWGGKPSIEGLNFSISHSNGYIIFAHSTTLDMGIDIEYFRELDINCFKYLFRDDEWSDIINDSNSLEKFFWFWIRKEALLKLVDCSLKDLKCLIVSENKGVFDDEVYVFTHIDVGNDYRAVMASRSFVGIKVRCVGNEF